MLQQTQVNNNNNNNSLKILFATHTSKKNLINLFLLLTFKGVFKLV